MQLEDQEHFDYHPALARRLERFGAAAHPAPPHLKARIREALAFDSTTRRRRWRTRATARRRRGR